MIGGRFDASVKKDVFVISPRCRLEKDGAKNKTFKVAREISHDLFPIGKEQPSSRECGAEDRTSAGVRTTF